MMYITDLEVSTNDKEEQKLKIDGFQQIHVNINTGTTAKNEVYLWFKEGEKDPIMRVQTTYNQEMETAMEKAKYTKIKKNLNSGTAGKPIYMWFSKARQSYDIPIVAVDVTVDTSQEAGKMISGDVWEAVSCDLNLGVGNQTYVYAWVKREKPFYISEVTAAIGYNDPDDLLSKGYNQVDVDTNLGAGGQAVFIYYSKTTDEKKSLTHLGISTDASEFDFLKSKGYELVRVNLNQDTDGDDVYLWKKKEALDHLRGIFLLRNMNAVQIYKDAEIQVIERSLNKGNRGETIYVCYVVQ